MQTKHVDVYKFDELDDTTKDRVIDSMHNINTDFEWWDCTIEDAKEIGALMGIEIKNVYFSGFSSQGDGACFEGYYSYKKNGAKAVKGYAPQDAELHRIASELQALQRKHFYGISCSVKQSGHYNHKYCTKFSFYDKRNETEWVDADTQSEFEEVLRDFMEWIYRQLETEYEYLEGREAIIETITANEYDFTEDGSLWR